MLAGGVDLVRDPRSGRNFEYAGEDPLLAGVMAGAAVRGIQAQHVVSTLKHFAVNDQETGRRSLDAEMDDLRARTVTLAQINVRVPIGDTVRGAPVVRKLLTGIGWLGRGIRSRERNPSLGNR